MTDITDLRKLCKWNLLEGSHRFPGPDGGTCINEAAVVAAGFQYRSIASAKQFPPCFSDVIGTYLLALNDSIPNDDLRTDLLTPFVIRLAGSADTVSVERWRVESLLCSVFEDVIRPRLSRELQDLPIASSGAQLVANCQKICTIHTKIRRVLWRQFGVGAYVRPAIVHYARLLLGHARRLDKCSVKSLCERTAKAMQMYRDHAEISPDAFSPEVRAMYTLATRAAERMLAIGNQGDIDTKKAVRRLRGEKRRARERAKEMAYELV